MSKPPAFLTVDQVLAIHRRMTAEFGGDPGVRDCGLLESAVSMPASRFGGEHLHAGLPEMAAAYLFHICRNHAFVDGNKRTSLAAAEMFLLLNGMRLVATDDELYALTAQVAACQVSKEIVTAFFREHVVPDRA